MGSILSLGLYNPFDRKNPYKSSKSPPLWLNYDVMLAIGLECDISTIVKLKETCSLWADALESDVFYKKVVQKTYFFREKPSKFPSYK